MPPPELNLSQATQPYLCSPEIEVVHDEQLQISYQTEIPCGFTKEQAIDRFRRLYQEGKLDPSRNRYVAKLFQLKTRDSLATIPTPLVPTSPGVELIKGILLNSPLGIFFASGCNKPPWPKTGSVQQKGNLKMRVDLAGNPEHGMILFIRQIHFPNPVYDPMSVELMQLSIEYQKKIYEYLSESKLKHVFSEALDQDFPPAQHQKFVNYFLEKKNLLDQELADSPEPQVLKNTFIFGVLGADLVYGYHNSDVFLHKVMNQAEGQYNEVLQKRSLEGESIDEDYVYETREEWATREMLDVLQANPGITIGLVYGLSHNFCDNFIEAGFKPTIISLWWDLPSNVGNIEYHIPSACD